MNKREKDIILKALYYLMISDEFKNDYKYFVYARELYIKLGGRL